MTHATTSTVHLSTPVAAASSLRLDVEPTPRNRHEKRAASSKIRRGCYAIRCNRHGYPEALVLR